jgi:repressor LexA
MVSAGIDSGDMVIIREQADAREGDIVASLINHNSSTLKRLCRDEQGLYLWAENDSWDDKSRFYGREFEVQGVAVKVVKDIG